MSIKGKKVAILTHDHFEQVELEQPLAVLRKAGADVSVISAADTLSLEAMHHTRPGKPLQADTLLQDARADDYDALVLPGGVINADHLRMNETAREWVCDFLDKGKLVAAICHAPWLLVSADAVEEKRLTSYYTLQDDIRNAGGEWVDQSLVKDQNLFTSRKPDDLPEFVSAIIKWFKK